MAISCGDRTRATGTTRTPGNADNTRRQNGQSKTILGSLNPEILPESSRVRIKERPRCTYSSGTCSAQSSQRPSVARKAATASSVSGKSSPKPWISVCTARVNSRIGIASKCPCGLLRLAGHSSHGPRERPCSINALAVRLEPLRCIESRMTSVRWASSMILWLRHGILVVRTSPRTSFLHRRNQVSHERLGNRESGYLGKPMEHEIPGENEFRFLLEEYHPAQLLFDASLDESALLLDTQV